MKVDIEQIFNSLHELEPEFKIFPKLHHLTHYPEMIKQYGPLILFSSLPFERKHQFFKQWARIMRNSINPAYSLAERHQCEQALIFKSKSYENINFDFTHLIDNPELMNHLPPSAIFTSETPCMLNKGIGLLQYIIL
jgi:hypothetical protein